MLGEMLAARGKGSHVSPLLHFCLAAVLLRAYRGSVLATIKGSKITDPDAPCWLD